MAVNAEHKLIFEIRDRIGFIYLARPPHNALDVEMLTQIADTLAAWENDAQVWGVILASQIPETFSPGLEMPALLEADIPGREKIFRRLFDTIRAIYSFPKPVLALVNGHATTGGAALAIGADWRFMCSEKARFGFGEIHAGISIPSSLLAIIEGCVGAKNMRSVALMGEMYKPEECLALGLADELYPRAELLPRGERFLKKIFLQSQNAVISMKKNLRGRVIAQLNDDASLADIPPLLGVNFSEGISALIEGRRAKFENG